VDSNHIDELPEGRKIENTPTILEKKGHGYFQKTLAAL
jgi:hypothetical protein